jgi:aspartyl/asparaginyl-tRNA synthetase
MIFNKMNTCIFFIFLANLMMGSNIPAFKSIDETLYIGVENTITIDLKGCDPELVEIKVNSGHLYKRSDSTYIMTISQLEDEVKIKLYYKKVIVEIKTLKTGRIPEPTLIFEFESDGKISRKKNPNPGKLSFVYPTSYPENQKLTIISFFVSLIDSNGMPMFSANMRNDSLDEQAINQLKRLNPGSSISISHIISQHPTQGTRQTHYVKQLLVVD